ncbi:PIN-like domain-containing protein [Sedimentibacter sp.]|uniref:PIN-like domain-containing protein n=1 Tax=Sedimentibacter sp. TaxID=1960295 RepID=UPI0028B01FD1|nr:PIN-like domain-containing protein [Sedimentibacter sp.]
MDKNSTKEFKRIWNEGIISVDTSALIFLQECNAELAKYVMDTLLFAEDRIWITPQVAQCEMVKNFSYSDNNDYGSIGRLNKFQKTLTNSVTKIDNVFITLSNELREEGHELLADVITSANTNELFYSMLSEFNTRAKETSDENRKFIQSGLVKIFQHELCKKTSNVFNDEEIAQIKEEGIQRYENKIPPGYCDHKKDDNEFGDLIVWKELLQKSKLTKRPILFITRDKKEDWFSLEGNSIIDVRGELLQEAKKFGAVIHILYFNDFVSLSAGMVSKDISNLINILERNDELVIQIEDYIHSNMYGEIQDELSNVANSEYNSDFVMIDCIESVDINNSIFEVFDDYVEIECQVKFEASVDHNYHYDSREENIELSGSMVAIVDARVTIEILSGQHDENNKMLDTDSTEIEFGQLEVISSSDPLGHDDIEPYYEDDYDEEYGPNYDEDNELDYDQDGEFNYESYYN